MDRVLIDRMNCTSSVKGFYRKLGVENALKDAFFIEQRDRLASELGRRGIPAEVLF